MHAHILLSFVAVLTTPAPCDELLTALDTLAHGSTEARWQLLDEGVPYVDNLLGADNEEIAACFDRARAALLSILRTETDDRIVVRLLDDITWDDCDQLGSYPLEALSHRSPNVRRRAAEIVSDSDCGHTPAQLRTMWNEEPRPWIRSAVAFALASVGDRAELDDFHRLALDDRTYLGDAATQVIIDLSDPRSTSILDHLAESGSPLRSDLAKQALAAMRPQVEPGPDFRAIVARDEPDSAAGRDPLAGQLGSCTDDAVVTHDPPPDPEPPRGLPLRSASLASDLDFGSFLARPEDGGATERCWDAPGYAYPADIHPRIPAGVELHADDVFEWKGEIWYYVIGPSVSCWVPAGSVAADTSNAPGITAGTWEFDMSRDELASYAACRAEHAGFATVFDEADEVVGIRLAPPSGDRERLLWVLDTWETASGAFAKGLSDWLWVNAGAWVGDKQLEGRIAASRHPSS